MEPGDPPGRVGSTVRPDRASVLGSADRTAEGFLWWWTTPRVLVADAGRELTFVTELPREAVDEVELPHVAR